MKNKIKNIPRIMILMLEWSLWWFKMIYGVILMFGSWIWRVLRCGIDLGEFGSIFFAYELIWSAETDIYTLGPSRHATGDPFWSHVARGGSPASGGLNCYAIWFVSCFRDSGSIRTPFYARFSPTFSIFRDLSNGKGFKTWGVKNVWGLILR